MEIVTTETLPVEASMSGSNTCYLHCASLNRRSNYGVCLFTIRAFNREKLHETSDCYSLIGRGLCEALAYQKKEQEAGRALFFKARAIPIKDVTADSTKTPARSRFRHQTIKPGEEGYMSDLNAEANIPQTKSSPAAKKPKAVPKVDESKLSAIFGTETADLTDAVDEVVKAEMAKKEKPTSEEAKPKASGAVIRPGMSILERARAMAGK